MAVPVIASSTGRVVSGTTTITFVKSTDYAGIAVGDLIVVFYSWSRNATGGATLPSGFSVPTNASSAWEGNSDTGSYVATKVADSGDVAAANLTFDATGGSPFAAMGIIQIITGATGIEAAANQLTTSGSTGTFPSVTTLGADRLIQTYASQYLPSITPSGSQWPNVAPSGMTVGTQANYTATADYIYTGTAYGSQASAGASGAKTVTIVAPAFTSRQLKAITIAIRPAASDPPYIRPVSRADHLLRR